MRAERFFCLVGLLGLAASIAAAAQQPQVVLSVDVKEEITLPDAQGSIRTVRRDVDRADPGDVLVYTLTYTNFGSDPAVNARVDDPIPAGTVLLPGSVVGEKASITYSVDGGRTFTTYPATITVAGPDGKPVTKEAPAESYTHIRWIARDALRPGESRSASFKVVVR